MASRQVYDFFVNKGLTPAQAAGVAGNAFAESGYDPTAFNPAGGGQGAYGAFQWRGDRQTGLRDFAKNRGSDASDLVTQMEYAWHEMQNKESAAYDALLTANTPAEAAKIFRDKYERPGGHGYNQTIAEAQRIGREYAELTPQPGQQALSFGTAVPPQAGQPPHQPVAPTALNTGEPYRPPVEIDTTAASLRAAQDMGLMDDYGFSTQGPEVQTTAPMLTVPEPVDYSGILAAPEAPVATGVTPDLTSPTSPVNELLGMSSVVGPTEPLTAATPEEISPQGGETLLSTGVEVSNDDAKAAVDAGIITPAQGSTLIDEPDDAEDTSEQKADNRRALGIALEQLGLGLSQMSRGQPVNVSSVPQRYNRMDIAEQDLAIDQQREQRLADQFAADQDYRARSLAVQEAQMAIDAMLDVPLTQSMIDYATRNQLSPALYETEAGRKELLKRMADEEIGGGGAAAKEPAEIASARIYQEAHNANLGEGETPMTLDEAIEARANNYGQGQGGTEAERLGKALYDAHPKRYASEAEAVLEAGSRLAGIDTGSAIDKAAGQAVVGAWEKENDIQEQSLAGVQDSVVALDNIAEIDEQLFETDAVTGPASELIGNAQQVANQLGFNSVGQFLQQFSGLTSEQVGQMSPAQQTLAFAIARQNKGQGSITEQERANIIKQVANMGQSKEARAVIVAQAQAMNAIDEAVYRRWNTVSIGDRDALGAFKTFKADMIATTRSISKAAANSVRAANPANYPTAKVNKSTSDEEVVRIQSPKLRNQEQIDFMLPALRDMGIQYYVGPDNNVYPVN